MKNTDWIYGTEEPDDGEIVDPNPKPKPDDPPSPPPE